MNRRKFFKTTSLGAALAFFDGFGGRVENLLAFNRSKNPRDLLEFWAVSTCAACEAGCGIKARLVGGRVIGIVGNEESPVSRGGLCARGFAGIQSLYNPDRLSGPLLKNPESGTGEWKKLSWDEALGVLTEKLVSGGRDSNSAMLITGDRDSLTARLLTKFVSSMGSGSAFYYPWGDALMAHPAIHVAQGIDQPLVYDVENASHILSFSNDFLQTGPSHVTLSRAFGRFRRSSSRLRGRLVHFDSRLSITASKADEWIAINPWTEGAVALAIASTLLEEGLYDKRFVSGECVGFDEWIDDHGNRHPGFRSVILEEFSPQKVSEISGVSPEVIIKTAREFAGSSHPIALGSDRIDFSYQDLTTRLAIHSLNALVGNIDKEGGILVPRRVPAGKLTASTAIRSQEMHDSKARYRFPVSLYETDSTLDRLLEMKPPEVLFLYATNPLFTSPRKHDWQKFIDRAKFVVSFESFMDETAGRAHLLLPDSHYLEKWNQRTTWTNRGYPVFNVGKPVIEPVLDTRCTGDVVLDLTRRVLGEGNNDFPWSDFEAVIKDEVGEIHRVRRGDVFGSAFEEMWVRLLERIGWRAATYPDLEKFWKKCVEKGGWWDPIYYFGKKERVYQNEQGKFDFGLDLVRKRARHVGTIEGLYRLEKFKSARTDETDPFGLLVNGHYPLLGASSRNEPFLMELMTNQIDHSGEWKMWVEMNPDDAETAGFHENDIVTVETAKGKITGTLKLFAGNPPGMVSVPFGLGRKSGGRYVEGIGENPVEIVQFDFDQLTGIPKWGSTFVKVRKSG